MEAFPPLLLFLGFHSAKPLPSRFYRAGLACPHDCLVLLGVLGCFGMVFVRSPPLVALTSCFVLLVDLEWVFF